MKACTWKGLVSVFALIVLLSANIAWAQQGAGTVRGVVTDPQGKVVPNAKVTLTNDKTKFIRTQMSGQSGNFSFELIPIGDYNVSVEADGFRKQMLSNLHALVGNVTEANVQLQIGSISEVMTVEAAATDIRVNTQDATLGNNFLSRQILQLPLEARNVTNLLTLQPGVTGSPMARGYVAGARSDQSNVTLDGVDINEAQTGQITGSQTQPEQKPVLRLNSEAIEEFRVNTTNANSSQGRSSGAQINLVTKSGSNDWHGSGFWYYRGTGFTANDFFNTRTTPVTPRTALIRNTFGGTVGGPVIKDKVFFFYSFEGRTDRSGASGVRTVPFASMGQGIVNVVAANCATCASFNLTITNAQLNTIFPSLAAINAGNALNPAALGVLAGASTRYPINDNTVGDGQNVGGFRFNAPTPVDLRSNVAKIDWNMNHSMTLSIRLNAIFDLTGRLPQFPDTPPPNIWEHPYGGVISHNWVINSRWVNSFRYGLTRTAFSSQGDSSDDSLSFRFVFSPRTFSRTLARTTPVYNIVDDLSWIKGNHTVQFGMNFRITRNSRSTFAAAFDSAITNPSFYAGGGNASISNPVRNFLRASLGQPTLILVNNSSVQNAVTAMIGRYSQYSGNFTFDHSGAPLPAGTPSARTFATEDYDTYFQDTWRIARNLTLTYGLRYSLGRPVYETKGFEVKPGIPLDVYFSARRAAELQGINFTAPLTLDLSGPANGRSPMYRWDKNNFQPRVALAWQPNFENKWLTAIFGTGGKSVIRGGAAITNDYYGQSLAVAFDLNNTLGFTGSTNINANAFNTTTNPAPLFTSFTQDVRTLPGISAPTPVIFPATPPITPTSSTSRAIQASLDEGLTAPVNYQFSMTFERELPKGLTIQASYLGRLGRKLLATRDIMALSNTTDPKSGQTWYQAATVLEKLRQTGAAPGSVPAVPWFENMLPANYVALSTAFGYSAGNGYAAATNNTQMAYIQAFGTDNSDGWQNDWTDEQAEMEQIIGQRLFFQSQFGALSSWGTIANSNYHALAFTIRQRLRDVQWDLNYTFSHSLDDASGLQTSGTYGSAFILNPVLQKDNYGHSDFDIRHQINVSGVFTLPFGRGKRFFTGAGRAADAVIGGWQLSSIWRWNTGVPIFSSFDDVRWATNWNVQSTLFQTPNRVDVCPTRGTATIAPKLFGCNTLAAYHSFRNAYPGETGPRNTFRLPGYVNLDMGLSKSFNMPFNEKHQLQLRWEVFNVTNTQRLGTVDTSRTGFGMPSDPVLNNITPTPNYSNFTAIQGSPRVMQIGLRYSF